MMDMDELAAPEPVELAVEPDAVAEEEEEYEEMITIRASYLLTLQDSLDDLRFRIANIERDEHQA
jgi:hypothetical protein